MLSRIAALGLVVLAAADPEWVKQVEAWRAKHEADYTRDYVPLAGLAFLKDGHQRRRQQPFEPGGSSAASAGLDRPIRLSPWPGHLRARGRRGRRR